MALHTGLSFQVSIVGDGTSSSITLLLSTAPITLLGVSSTFITGFVLGAILPVSIIDISDTTGTLTAATLGILDTTLTLTFSAPLTNGAITAVTGVFLF